MNIMDPTSGNSGDDDLMLELKQALAAERLAPDHVMEAAKAAFEWRRVDEELELLSLSYDSSQADLAGVRGPAATATRTLVFDGEGVTVELELGTEVLMGQVVPPDYQRIILECADGRVDEADTDDIGVFLLRRPTGGPIRLRCHQGRSLGVVTEWMLI
jgi:hypothetical protein